MRRRRNVIIDQDKPDTNDDAALFTTRTGQGNTALRGEVPELGERVRTLPSPSVDGAAGALNRLGWTAHPFGQSYNCQPFRGGAIKPPAMTLNDGGNVGFSTRSQRLHNRLLAAYTDQFPDQRTTATEILNGGVV